jgi:hypothetical protein
LLGAEISEVGHFFEVVTGVYHQQWIRNAAAFLFVDKGFFGTLEHDQGIFASREKQGGTIKGGSHFAQDKNGFFF